MGPLQWGDVPTAVGALFAGGAAWFAFQTIKSQRQQIGEQREFIAEQTRFMDEQRQNLALERAELLAVAEERRRAQADAVELSASTQGVSRSHMDASRPESSARRTSSTVVVRNGSDEPLRDIVVEFVGGDVQIRAVESPGLPEGQRIVPVLGAGKYARFISHATEDPAALQEPAVVMFTDIAGVRWRKDLLGDLTEMSP